MPEKSPVYLIDGSAYFYRAYHAIAPLTTANGLPTHAAYGFTNILLRVIREKEPEFLAVAFDAKGPTFRHEKYSDYKANRPAMPDDLAVQIPYIKKIVRAHNILTMEQQGVEADDLIASAAKKLAAAGHRVVIISGDKDLLQLVNDAITVWDPMKDVVIDREGVKKKYNVGPESLRDLFALIGDKSDNIPGVPGIGPKTAEKLINEFGTLENLYKNLENLKKGKMRDNLAAHRDDAFLSRELIDLKEDIDIPLDEDDYRLPEPKTDTLKEIYKELEFTRLMKAEIPVREVDRAGFALVQTEEELAGLVTMLTKADYMVLDTETSGLDPLSAELVGISVCVNPEQAFYIPTGHRDKEGNTIAGQLANDIVLQALQPFLENENFPKLGHNLKFDYSVIKIQGGGLCLQGPLWDTMIASYLLDPGRRTFKLDDLCREFLDLKLTTFIEVTGGDKRPEAFVYVSLEEAKNYSCEDVYGACLLWEEFRPKLEKQKLWTLFSDLETPLVPILADMELAGIRVDTRLLQELSLEFGKKLAELEKEIFKLAGEEFNINSTRQLGEILFDKLKLPHGRKTKTGYSTDVKVLEKLSFHELPQAVLVHRNLSKLLSTYVEKLAGLVHPLTNRVHTSFNQTVTATGRLSSSNPNLQNIPVRTEEGQRIRQAFVPEEGHVFLAGDYSQIDLRVLAHYSQDKELLDAFCSGRDIHNQTAAEIFFVSPMLITPQMRRVAKTINFGIVYGMSSFGLASQLNLSRKEAQTFIDRYFKHYSGVQQFMEDIVKQAREDRYVTTMLNRIRLLPDINSSNRTRREFAERTAINTPIQGTAADIIKLAMIKVERELQKTSLKARMLLQIHDELVFEVPENEIEQTEMLVKECMESVMELDVPLVVNISVGSNLAKV
ncbi:MAG: DNA polymerase I [Deltaproteobacteria bacterium]|jgi:DNA polymerase-1|nr:DNA polymerase I [Deltaproteobacteria bacterium]